MSDAASILVVEDEADIQGLLRDYLQHAGMQVTLESDGAAALERLKAAGANDFDVVILDIMLPTLDGLAVCQQLREFSHVPVIFLTARHDEIDRLLGLRLGADDYICKPFSPREVVARVEAIVRRHRWQQGATAQPNTGLQLDTDSYTARLNGQPIDLTPVEFRLLHRLQQQPGRVFRRDQLVQAAYDDYRVVSDRTIDSHIKNLRIKLQQVAPELQLIHSVYGVGYRFEWPTPP